MDLATDLPEYLRERWINARDNAAAASHLATAGQYAALLQLLDLHTSASSTVGPYCSACSPSGNKHRWPCTTLRTLALPYAGAVDFNTELWSL